MRPRPASVLLAAALALLPAGALRASEAPSPGTFVAVVATEPDSFDPAWSQDVTSMGLILNVYETLLAFEGESTEKIVPLLAEKVPSRENGLISADGLTYVLPIRKGVRFHDGSPMTPEDVRYSMLRFLLSDRTAGPSWLLLGPLTGLSSTRGETGAVFDEVWEKASRAVSVRGGSVVLTLPKPYAPLLKILASRAPVVVSSKWAAANGAWDGSRENWKKFNDKPKQDSPFFERANGTGPFRLVRWDKTKREIVLSRNDAYWREPAKLEGVIVRSIKEFGLRKLMIKTGDADSIEASRSFQTQLDGLPGVTRVDGLKALHMPALFFTYAIEPRGNPFIGSGRLDGDGVPPDFFKDKDTRKGFAYSIDYGALIQEVLRGKGRPATGCIPAGLFGHDERAPRHAFDPAKAREHLERAFGGEVWRKGFHLTLTSYSGDALGEIVTRMLKRNLEALNPKFKVVTRALDWPIFLDARKAGKLPLFVTAWSAKYPDPHDFVFAFLHSNGLYPSTQKFSRPGWDELVEAANGEGNAGKRAALYARLQREAFEEVPHVPLADPLLYRTQRAWVEGWIHNPVFPNAPYLSSFYEIRKR